MGYSFRLCSIEKNYTIEDVQTALENLSPFNKGKFGLLKDKGGNRWHCRTDVALNRNLNIVTISGSYIFGQYAEGMVLNMMINLQNLGYTVYVHSTDWEYGQNIDKWVSANL
jgi:hypothetical protein